MSINFDLFKGDVGKIKEQLENEKSKLERFSQQVTKDVALDMEKNIRKNANSISGSSSMEDSTALAELSRTINSVANANKVTEVGKNHTTVSNSTEEATYAEFGTGMIGAGTPHVLSEMGWQYDVNSHGVKGWRFIGESGRLVHTLGYPAFSTYFNSYNETYNNLGMVAKLTFREVFGDSK